MKIELLSFRTLLCIAAFISTSSMAFTSQSAVSHNYNCKPEFIGGVKELPNDLVATKFTDNISIKAIHVSKIPITALSGFKNESLKQGFPDSNDGLRAFTEKLMMKRDDSGESGSYVILTPLQSINNFGMYLGKCDTSIINKEVSSIECMGDINRSFRFIASTGRFQYSEVGNWAYHDKSSDANPKSQHRPSFFVYGKCEKEVN